MRRLNLLLTILFLLYPSCCLQAVTRIEKNIVLSEDTVWEEDMEIAANVLVPVGKKLTIQSGVRLTFFKLPEPSTFEIRGQLICLGTAARPVVFTSNVKQPESWQGLSFYMETEQARDDFPSVLNYVRIEYTKEAIRLERVALELTGGLLTRSTAGLIISYKGKAVVKETDFFDLPQTGVTVERGGEVELTKNKFRFCRQGIQGGGAYTLVISDNIFNKNQTGIRLANTSNNTRITANVFTENQYGLWAEKRSEGELRGNEFTDNKYGAYFTTQSEFTVSHNLFRRNEVAIGCNRMAAPLIRQNDFWENKLALACVMGSYPFVNENNFSQNQTAIFLRFLSSDWSGRNNGEGVAEVFDATRNWWGEEQTAIFAGKKPDFNRSDIFDGYDVPYNQDRGHVFQKQKVSYQPWLTERVSNTYPENQP